MTWDIDSTETLWGENKINSYIWKCVLNRNIKNWDHKTYERENERAT